MYNAAVMIHIVCSVLVLSEVSLQSPVWLSAAIIILIIIIIILVITLRRVFTIIYLKQTMFLGSILLQLVCIYSLCYM